MSETHEVASLLFPRLQILPKSHLAGRVDHKVVGEQAGADLERVDFLRKDLGGEVAVEMEPGDALFFHCNVLHSSAQNRSPHRRWAFLVAYNRRDNNPLFDHHHPRYTPLHKVGELFAFPLQITGKHYSLFVYEK